MLSGNVSNSLRDWFGNLYREIKTHTLSPVIILKFIHSWKKGIPHILKGKDFRKRIQTGPRLVLTGWFARTRLYPGISKLNLSNKIPLSEKVS